ncbi:MAG: NAD-dependent succinate-semialdehyde dehydrogenase [Cyclobacteriaceae bacterium]
MLKSINPYNNELIGSFEQTSIEELDVMLNKAQEGFAVWRQTSFDDRSMFLKRLASDLKENKEEYASLISREMGKVIKDSRKEVDKSAMALEYFAQNGEGYLSEKKIDTEHGEGRVVYEPMGVILGIMPWNYPFWQFFRFAATTLMAGNNILLKHSSNVPACSKKIEEIFQKTSFPGGVFQSLIISSSKINNIIKDFRVQGVSLTGGLNAGSDVAEHAGRHIKKSVLELGGNDPFIVLEDADIKKAAKAGVKSRMKNFGQACNAAKRFILHESIAAEFLSEFRKEMEAQKFGDPMDKKSDYASLSSKDQKKLLEKQVEQSLNNGAELYWQGDQAPEKDAFFNPIILTKVKPDMPAYHEELFGPVASVITVSDGLEAARIANDTDYGLGASIWTEDIERGWKFAREIQAGIIYINGPVSSRPELPFGGTKKSGLGREMAGEGSREFTNKKSLWYNI